MPPGTWSTEGNLTMPNIIGTNNEETMTCTPNHDNVEGLDGDATLIANDGADVLDGGTGNDDAFYLTATSGVTADLLTPASNTGDAAGDTYISIENLFGSNFADQLFGD